MPDDRHTQTNPAAAVLLAVACLACASAAGAQTLRGYGQVQYQSLRNGKVEFDREWWVTSFQADYAARLRPTLDLTAQIQFTKLDFAGRPEGSRVPFGSLRLTHTQFGVFGSYRPTTQTDALGF